MARDPEGPPGLASAAGPTAGGREARGAVGRGIPAASAGAADGEPGDPLDAVAAAAATCRRCRLCETRTTVVFGDGPRRPRLMVIGEAPGAEEDASGHPFVGRSGDLLTKMLAAIGLARADVYIANVLKCRPPGNRSPAPDEAAACRSYLDAQIRSLDPELLLLLGTPATQAVLGTDRGITAMRGQRVETPDGRAALATYHPAYLLRNPAAKREAWLDLQRVASTLRLSVPPRSG